MEGGFFLRKKPLSSMASVYTNSENAIGPEERYLRLSTIPQGLKPNTFRSSIGTTEVVPFQIPCLSRMFLWRFCPESSAAGTAGLSSEVS
jgi:hypothetical protein